MFGDKNIKKIFNNKLDISNENKDNSISKITTPKKRSYKRMIE